MLRQEIFGSYYAPGSTKLLIKIFAGQLLKIFQTDVFEQKYGLPLSELMRGEHE